ncbi:dimethylsulfonioproprionate lyase family protein [Acinetobacter nosocomialis]|uniref:dimethylsulfonioproprionate lyase family protein n=1 Tax=Acinetobacter nosocomialis TaxID=106654 RepID=UPI001F32C58C|nr:cupin domain-containing protein [Acinetobacter nosocomialis]MCE7531662.1 cupin domain-containing protein [Acinetobacter nosocomialis]
MTESNINNLFSGFEKIDFNFQFAHDGNAKIYNYRKWNASSLSYFNFIDFVILPPNSSIGYHCHSEFDEEVYVIISGKGIMKVNNYEFEVKTGDVIVNPPNNCHGLTNKSSEEIKLVVLDACDRRLNKNVKK